MLSFSIPRHSAERLARLPLACAHTGILAHVVLRSGHPSAFG